jgi:hypothetical protein
MGVSRYHKAIKLYHVIFGDLRERDGQKNENAGTFKNRKVT